VEYFSTRPVRLFSPAGTEVASENLGKGRWKFLTGGQTGAWGLEGGEDDFLTIRQAGVESFVKIEKPGFPLVLALGDPKRLFDIGLAPFKSSTPRLPPPQASTLPFGDSLPGFGQALRLNGQFVQVPLPAAAGGALTPGETPNQEEDGDGGAGPEEKDTPRFPHDRGTVEFWMMPLWSTTDAYMLSNTESTSTFRGQFYRGDPIGFSYWLDPDNGGRTGRYNIPSLFLDAKGAGNSRAKLFFESGKWYHVAFTWNVDGKNSECDIFINGRKKAFSHYAEGMAKDVSPAKLAPPGQDIRFGSGRIHGHLATGELYDELRVSRSVRYRDDFDVPAAPFQLDADTCLLMHFDGNFEGSLNGKPATAKLVPGGRM
jgi:hypothetical protein